MFMKFLKSFFVMRLWLGVLLVISPAFAYAMSGSITMTAKVDEQSKGLGTVYVAGNEGTWTDDGNGGGNRKDEGRYTSNQTRKWTYRADENEGCYFVSWKKSDGSETITESEKVVTLTASSRTPNPSVTYEASFKYYRYGYKYPLVVYIDGIGQISVDGENWSSENIPNASVSYTNDELYKKQEEKFLITFYADEEAGSEYAFVGWFDESGELVSDELEYEMDITDYCRLFPDKDEITTPILTARFKPQYYYVNTVSAVAEQNEDGQDVGLVYVSTDAGLEIDDINDEDWDTQWTMGVGSKVCADNFSFTYYAKPSAVGYAFQDWVKIVYTSDPITGLPKPSIEVVSQEPKFTYALDSSDENWDYGEANAYTIPEFYARFRISTNFYHHRATVGVAYKSEPGKVYVSNVEGDPSAEQWYTPMEQAPLYTSNEEITDENGDGVIDNNIVETPKDQNKYFYHYYAQPSEKAAFIGWTTQETGDDIISTNNPYSPDNYYASDDPANPHTPHTMYAVFRSYYYARPYVMAVGSGDVKIDDGNYQDRYDDLVVYQYPAIGDYKDYTFTLEAKNDEGATFLGWSTSDSEDDIFSNDPIYVVNERTSVINRNTPHQVKLYAIFESDIKIKHIDRMIYYQSNNNEYINDVNIIVEVDNAETLVASLSGNAADFDLIDQTQSQQGDNVVLDAKQGVISLRLKYVGTDNPLRGAIDKEAVINFVSKDAGQNTLATNSKIVRIEEAPIVTFLPADKKGTYTVAHTDGGGVLYTLDDNTENSVQIDVTQESKSYLHIQLEDKEGDQLEFFGWQMIDYSTPEPTISYVSYKKDFTYHFTKSVTIRPEFIPSTWARYIIKSNSDVQYYDLNDAIAQAKLGVSPDERIIVVYKDGLLPKGEYNIPADVTLLVPGVGPTVDPSSSNYNDEFICANRALKGDTKNDAGDIIEEGDFLLVNYTAPKCFRKLSVEEGTTINVENGAKICVYAKQVVFNQSYLTIPYYYGHIELGFGAQIVLKNGAELYSWGFITHKDGVRVDDFNYKEVGGVHVNNGAYVWESFSFRDFRGGKQTVNFVEVEEYKCLGDVAGGALEQLAGVDFYGYTRETFPINQYYIQNIEVPLMMNYGSTERVVTAIAPDGVVTSTSAYLVGKNNGLFRWDKSMSASLTKYYNPYTDRVKYIIEDTQKEEASMKLGNIGLSLNITLSGIALAVDINSENYVMPIQNNMDVYIKNAHMLLPNGINISFMPGSSMYVDKNSVLTNNAQVYVYDADQHSFPWSDCTGGNLGYVSPNDGWIYTMPHRPGGMKVSRGGPLTGDANDAKLIVDGFVDNTNGYLITTEGGANITSNGGGSIKINKFGKQYTNETGRCMLINTYNYVERNQSVFQFHQGASLTCSDGAHATGFYPIPLSTSSNGFYPRLRNASGFTDANQVGTYYYCGGTWTKGSKPADCTHNDPNVDYNPRFTINLPELSTYVGEGNLVVDLASVSNPCIIESNTENAPSVDRTWSATFTGLDWGLFQFNGDTKQLTFIPASAGTKSAVMILTATYEHEGRTYTYSQTIDINATAKDQTNNTLSFVDLTRVFAGQSTSTSLFEKRNNTDAITVTVTDKKGENVELSTLGINTTDYTIQPKANAVTDTFTITAEQFLHNHVKGTTISTQLIVNPRVVWNWSELYYPSVNEDPITMMDGSTNWTLEERIVTSSGDVVKFEGNGPNGTTPDTYKAEIFDLITGEFDVEFVFKQTRYEDQVFPSKIYRDPRYVRIDVNDPRVFKAITIGDRSHVSYSDDNHTVTLQSTEHSTNAWTIQFLGIPDKLCFIPTGDKAWQIEESRDGRTWTTTFTWAFLLPKQAFEFSLMPSTQYVRISYGANGTATLEDVYITKLEGVKFNPSKLYIPANVGASKSVAITYVSDADVSISSTNGEFIASQTQLDNTKSAPHYNIENVVITNKICTSPILTGVNVKASVGTEILPIQTFDYPQGLPVVLASDMPAERFYYLTPYAYNTTWDETSRKITMNNAVANAQPFMVFHFEGVPSYISFDHTTGIKGDWIIEWSTDGHNWQEPSQKPTTTSSSIKQTFNNENEKPTYLRVTYNSLYAEKVELTNLMIIGEEGAYASPNEITVEYIDADHNSKEINVTAINLANGMVISTDNPNFTLKHEKATQAEQSFVLDGGENGYPNVFANNKIETLLFEVYFNGARAVDYATITITNNVGEGEVAKVLATVKVTGLRTKLYDGDINMYTGVPDGTYDADGKKVSNDGAYSLSGFEEGKAYSKLDVSHAFAGGKAIFDYLYLFGETTTVDGTYKITNPTTIAGSNAKTPCYIYKRNGHAYDYHDKVENANASKKIAQEFLQMTDGEKSETIKVYITGFCPYVSTGYTKLDEGAFFFQGGAGDHVHVYLEDCYLYSRAKTEDGHFFENRSDGRSFTEGYVRGSGAILVFECNVDGNNKNPFQVTIHTRERNMLKSHYGCFLESVAGRAFQPSPSVQVHLKSDQYLGSYTTLNFTDEWPNATTGEDERTNGFLSLQKQVNNAPSIDLGNPNTVVNFNGGQVELQNACNVSDNYNSTMAISYRGGKFAGFFLAYGLGSDETTGTVNFNDGTTTVKEMYVPERYREYYLLDKDGDNYITNSKGEYRTTCLRTPKNTFVYGGSHCMMRACESATSKGGAPTDGVSALGKFEYKEEYSAPNAYGLVTPTNFPNQCYLNYYDGKEGYQTNADGKKCYGLQSISPVNGAINLWLPSLECDDAFVVEPEVDQTVSFWKACMTYIEASYGLYGGHVGGDVVIQTDNAGQQVELVSNLLYCEIDQSIGQVISNNYSAPVKSPLPEGDPYMYITPSKVGKANEGTAENQNYILNQQDYQIENKIYYITTATADVWTTFTAPFDVEKIYIMETRHEKDLSNEAKQIAKTGTKTYLEAMKSLQAKNNADFAAFFGVAMVIHPNKTFDQIFADYKGWANEQDKDLGLDRRDKYEMTHFYKTTNDKGDEVSNWDKADYYLYKNNGQWELNEEQEIGYNTQWEFVIPQVNKPLMEQGETYLMLLPYCTGCWEYDDDDGVLPRDFWDYWTGKFLIFESTAGPHTLHGSAFVGAKASYTLPIPDPGEESQEMGGLVPENVSWEYDDSKGILGVLSNKDSGTAAIVSGNPTFSLMGTKNENVWGYHENIGEEGYARSYRSGQANPYILAPTQSFLYINVASVDALSAPVASVLRDGTIIYDNSGDGNTTGTHTPTVGGGHDLFITAISGGINVAVAYPQHVRVLSATGTVLYSGMVQTSVDVLLPTDGIYIVSGEKEVQKILY